MWHPEGRAFDTPPLTQFEAAARRAQRFTLEGPMGWPATPLEGAAHPDAPHTLDLRRYHADRPMPEAEPVPEVEVGAPPPDPFLPPQPLELAGAAARRVGSTS